MLVLPTKKEAEHIVDAVIGSLETTLLNNLGTNGFTLKLGSFGKFSVRHKPGILRKMHCIKVLHNSSGNMAACLVRRFAVTNLRQMTAGVRASSSASSTTLQKSASGKSGADNR